MRRCVVTSNITPFYLRALSSTDLVSEDVLDTTGELVSTEEYVCFGFSPLLTWANSTSSIINLQLLIPKERTAWSPWWSLSPNSSESTMIFTSSANSLKFAYLPLPPHTLATVPFAQITGSVCCSSCSPHRHRPGPRQGAPGICLTKPAWEIFPHNSCCFSPISKVPALLPVCLWTSYVHQTGC